MKLKKISEDFFKRYEKPPDNLYFCGMPLVFFKSREGLIGTSLSVGGYIAVSRRYDGRISLQHSDSNYFFRTNREELGLYKGDKICNTLLSLEKYGATITGGDILIYENTEIKIPRSTLLLCGCESFCKKGILRTETVKHFDNYEENILCFSSRENRLTALENGKTEYLPFHNRKYKIVLSVTGGKTPPMAEITEKSFAEAKEALCSGDAEKFGSVLKRSTKTALEKSRPQDVHKLYQAAEATKDATGIGILRGGVFSVVEESKVDSFIHDMGSIYGRYYGGVPDFYVTKTEDSAISLPIYDSRS